MDEERDIDLFAEEMYAYLFVRRMGVRATPPRQTPSNIVHHFTQDVGKAVLMICYVQQEKFRRKFTADADLSLLCAEIDACRHYCVMTAAEMSRQPDETQNVFLTLLIIGAMILELASFCSWQNFEDSKTTASTCWVEIFQSIFKQNFFERGGWQAQNETARSYAKLYDLAEYEKSFKPGTITVDRSWLMRYDRHNFYGELAAEVYDPPVIEIEDDATQHIDGELQHPELGFSAKDATAQEFRPSEQKTRNVEISGNVVSPPTTEGGSGKKNELDWSLRNLSSIKTKSAMQQGAILKTCDVTCKYSKKTSTDASSLSSNLKCIDSFISIIVSDDDKPGRELFEILLSPGNVNQLMDDKHFFKMMKYTVDNIPERKYNNAIMLATALKIISESDSTESSGLNRGLTDPDEISHTRRVTTEDSGLTSAVASSSNSEFLDSVLKIINRDNAMTGKTLFQFLSADLNIENLKSDQRFLELMEKLEKNPGSKSDNEMFREIALALSKTNPTQKRQDPDRYFTETCDVTKKSPVEEFGDEHQATERMLDNVPVLHSPPEETPDNVYGAEGFAENREDYEAFQMSESDDINSRGECAESVGLLADTCPLTEIITPDMAATVRRMRNLEMKDSEGNKLSSSPNKEKSTDCCVEKNYATQTPDLRVWTFFIGNIRRIAETDPDAEDSVNQAIMKVLNNYSVSVDEVEKFDLNAKTEILKSFLKAMSEGNLREIDNTIQLSRRINAAGQTPEQKEFADGLMTKIIKYQFFQNQTEREIERSTCNCCISKKVNIFVRLEALARSMMIDEFNADEKFQLHTNVEHLKGEQLQTTDVSASVLQGDVAASVSVEKDDKIRSPSPIQDIKGAGGECKKKNKKKKSRKRK